MAVKTSGNRLGWFSAVTVLLMDRGDTPLSIEQLRMLAARRVGPTARNDGYVTSRNNGGDPDSYEAGWTIIVDELVALLHEHGFVNGDLRWIGPSSGEVRWGGKPYVIRPADERQSRRDYNMITLGSKADYGEVQILGARGGITKKRLEVHPLAHLLPQIPREELAKLREDIDENGVLVPLLMFEEKVLDGRHRLYLATTLGKPVRLETFEGTEEEARARIGSLNLRRRHLTKAQVAQLAINLYMPEAQKEAAKAQDEARRKPKPDEVGSRNLALTKPGKKASQLVADKTGGAVSPRTIEAMMAVQDAPETLAKVQTGEIKTVTGAQASARAELGKKAPSRVITHGDTINVKLGRILGQFRAIQDELDLELGAEPSTIAERLDEIEVNVRDVRQVLTQRGLI